MKAKLTFNLDDAEDRIAHLRCVKSTDMAIVLFQISHNLKTKCESICDGLEADSDKYDGVFIVFQQISELLNDHGINIDELII